MGFISVDEDASKTSGEGYGYTEEEFMLKQNLHEFCQAEIEPRWQEAYNRETQNEFYHELLKKLGDMDILRLYVPQEAGGLGMRMTAMMIAIEEVSRVCGGLGIHVMEQQMYAMSARTFVPAAFERWGEGIMSGEILLAGSSCSPEGQANYTEIANIGTFDEETDEWVLNGAKAYSSGGAICDLLRIMGMVDGTVYHWYMVPSETEGLKRGTFDELGCSPSASWSMTNVRLPKDMGGRMPIVVNHKMAAGGYDAFGMSVAAMSLGCMEAAYDETVEYLTNRTYDFKPVINISAIQYKLARMKTIIEASRSFFIKATDLCEAGHKDAVPYSHMVKAYVCDNAREICEECIQMFGAVGYDNNTGVSRHLWDAIGFGIGCGTSDLQYRQAAYDLGFAGAKRITP